MPLGSPTLAPGTLAREAETVPLLDEKGENFPIEPEERSTGWPKEPPPMGFMEELSESEKGLTGLFLLLSAFL